MSDVAIRVENLGKRYRIGERRARHDTLRDALADGLRRHNVRRGTAEGKRDLWALRDVSFEIKRGEAVGVIGSNGAGKSTLLKILSRITEPTTGRATIQGRVGSLLEVGTGFHPELTGRENIYLYGAILGMRRAEIARRFDEIVAFAEIERLLDTPVKRYSSGMYVRLAFAVAAHLEPEVLLVDEVLAVGDAAFQKKCLGKMGDVAGEGRTVLFVSHNMAAVEHLCQWGLLLEAGRLRAADQMPLVVAMYLRGASQQGSGIVSLVGHPFRNPAYHPFLQELRLGTGDGRYSAELTSEGPFTAEVVINPVRPIAEPRVAFAIEDHMGRRIMTMASYMGGTPLPPITRPCRVSCTVPALDLGEGDYLVSVSIATRSEGILDSVDGAAWVHVVWRQALHMGEPYGSYYGPVVRSSTWACTPTG